MSQSISLSDFQKELEEMSKKAKALEKTTSVSFDILFNEDFMREHSHYSSFDELLEAGNFNVNSTEDFEAIPEDLLTNFICEHTDFTSWEEMQEQATEDYVLSELGFQS